MWSTNTFSLDFAVVPKMLLATALAGFTGWAMSATVKQ